GSGNSKTAQCATSSLAVGAHSIVATYGGDANNASASSTALSQTITLPATTTTLASSSNPAAVGTPVTFTATVAGTAPTGTVNFKDGGATFGGCGAVALTGSGNSKTAQCTTSSLAAGSHSIVAAYGGDAGNAGSSSIALSQAINAPLGTTLTSNNNPAVTGSLVTLTATVVGTFHPTGTVNFMDGGASIAGCGSVPVSGAGNTASANCATSSFSVGTHSLTAAYSGERSGNPPSTSTTLSQVVTSGGGPTTSTTAVASNLNPSTVGAAVTFTATVTGSAPTGNVDFRDGASSIAGCSAQPLSGSGNSRTATCTTSTLAQGTHSVTANYGGDAGNTSSASSALSQGVNPAGPTTSTTTLASAPNPSSSGAAVTFTATVAGTAPTGTVNFKDGATSVAGCAAVALTGSGNTRTAMCATSALSVGTHSMTAAYAGDAGNTASTSNTVSQVVNNVCVGRGC
ncbi:MAG TPA: Ig-like domain-containing protein, partial [Casimicrobiaceae bacterium]|nr:Ig-like domain-containing protein [Casimicrobiaceae bacterium]